MWFKRRKTKTKKALSPEIQAAPLVGEAAENPLLFRAETEALLTLLLEPSDEEAAEQSEAADTEVSQVADEVAAAADDESDESGEKADEVSEQDNEAAAETTELVDEAAVETDEDALGKAESVEEQTEVTYTADDTDTAEQSDESSAVEGEEVAESKSETESSEEETAAESEEKSQVEAAAAKAEQPKAEVSGVISGLYALDDPKAQPRPERHVGRWILGILLTLLLAAVGCVAYAVYSGWRVNNIYENGEYLGRYLSSKPDTETALAEAGIKLYTGDEIQSEQYAYAFQDINITRAFTVFVTSDGDIQAIRVASGARTVWDALELLNITLGDEDIILPDGGSLLYSDIKITVKRVTYGEEDIIESIPAEDRIKQTPLLKSGKTIRLDNGSGDGQKLLRYRIRFIDGVEESRELVSETVIAEPTSSLLLTGANVPASPLNGAKYTDVVIRDNVPSAYQSVIEAGVCTAYSFKPGCWGASGMYLIQGFVAVDPDKIPLGSLLYITSADGSFVYGWAIAADVCEASVEGRVNVDCFFETYRESQLFGRHTMNIYVVDQLHQADLAEYVAKEGYFMKRIPE